MMFANCSPTKSSAIRLTLAVLAACVVLLCGCDKNNYFGRKSVETLKDDFKGYANNEKKQPHSFTNTVTDYAADEKERTKRFPDQFPPFVESQKKDAHNFLNTMNEYSANQ